LGKISRQQKAANPKKKTKRKGKGKRR